MIKGDPKALEGSRAPSAAADSQGGDVPDRCQCPAGNCDELAGYAWFTVGVALAVCRRCWAALHVAACRHEGRCPHLLAVLRGGVSAAALGLGWRNGRLTSSHAHELGESASLLEGPEELELELGRAGEALRPDPDELAP